MKITIDKFVDWFENKFSFLIDITALVGSIVTILLSVFIFVMLLFNGEQFLDRIYIIFIPGFLGFLSIIMLFALRITRHLTKK